MDVNVIVSDVNVIHSLKDMDDTIKMSHCKFCNTEFKTTRSLDTHVYRKPNYCLKIREKNKCSGCLHVIPFLDVESHKAECLSLRHQTERRVEISKHVEDKAIYQIENDKLKAEIQTLKSQLRRKTYEMLTMKDEYEDRLSKTEERYEKLSIICAKKETVTNTTINNNQTTNQVNQYLIDQASPLVLDPIKLQALFDSNYTEDHFNRGLKGLADFTTQHILTNKDGNKIYVMTDMNRHTFSYLDSDGKVKKDKQATHLINGIRPPCIKTIEDKMFDTVTYREQEYPDSEAKNFQKYIDVKNINNKEFCKELTECPTDLYY